MGSRAFIVQGCPCVPCRCRRSFTNNTNKSTVSQIIYSVPQMRFTWLAKPSRFHMVCETMKRFTWFVEPCEIRTIKPVNFLRTLTKPCEITDPYGSLRSDVPIYVNQMSRQAGKFAYRGNSWNMSARFGHSAACMKDACMPPPGPAHKRPLGL
jgi:hypothetical protein